ncbi:MAG: hypothetical protein V1766_03740 [Pseudomonadota bacterium]
MDGFLRAGIFMIPLVLFALLNAPCPGIVPCGFGGDHVNDLFMARHFSPYLAASPADSGAGLKLLRPTGIFHPFHGHRRPTPYHVLHSLLH